MGTAGPLEELWVLGRLAPPGRAEVPVSRLMDGSWQDPDPIGSHPVAALGINVSWHKPHPAPQVCSFMALASILASSHLAHGGWVEREREESGDRTGA